MQKKQTILVVASLLVVVLSVTLAYFTAQIIGEGKNISVTSTDLKIVFTDSDGAISGSNIEPGWSNSKTFTIENKSNETYKYNIVIQDLLNTFVTNGYLQYKITSTNNGYNMTEFKDVPKSEVATDTILAYSASIDVGVTQSYTVEFIYKNDESVDQSEDMGKTLSGTLYIEKGTLPTLAEKLLADNPTIQTRTDFNTTFTETNTGTLYKATESIAGNTPKDVYYFAGDAKNNWVKFGKYQNDLIRYRGYYSTTDTSYREYSTMDECTSASSYNINCTEYKYANTGDDIYWRIIRNNYDGSIRLLYSGTSHNTTAGYIATSAFTNKAKMDPMYAGYMYGTTGSLENNRLNTNDSTIKTYIDNWYNNNLSSYSKFISTEAVYCNDRELAPGLTYNTGNTTFYYAPRERLSTNKTPTYNCTNNKDAFSGSNSEAKLDYPIGLMTADELVYAGGKFGTTLPSPYAWYYLNSAGGSITGSTWWWSLSPYGWYMSFSHVWNVRGSNDSGFLDYYGVRVAYFGARPAISLKSCTLWTSGNGAPETPYEISTTSGC